MNSGTGSIDPTQPAAAISTHLVGPAFLRHYRGYDLVTWQPRGTLDDTMLEQIAEWLVNIEQVFIPTKRFVDLSELKIIAIRTRHLFEFARKRAQDFRNLAPVRTALFCEEWVGLGIARMYESLMENTLIEARAFHDRRHGAEWLGIPMEILTLKDEPAPAGKKVS
jgi:hypothetical protein